MQRVMAWASAASTFSIPCLRILLATLVKQHLNMPLNMPLNLPLNLPLQHFQLGMSSWPQVHQLDKSSFVKLLNVPPNWLWHICRFLVKLCWNENFKTVSFPSAVKLLVVFVIVSTVGVSISMGTLIRSQASHALWVHETKVRSQRKIVPWRDCHALLVCISASCFIVYKC